MKGQRNGRNRGKISERADFLAPPSPFDRDSAHEKKTRFRFDRPKEQD